MKPAALLTLLAVLLLFVDVRGQLDSVGRCRCQDAGVNRIQPSNIQQLQVFPSSHSCPNMEIIVTLKNGVQKCLNAQSQFAKNYVKRGIKKRSAEMNI